MVYFKINFVLFINFLSIFKVSLLETVHFTNSPNKILRANNFTTYKVDVPNGDPITIIEANTPLINKNLKFNEVEPAKYSAQQNRDNRNRVVDLKTSLSMTVTPHIIGGDDHEKAEAGGEESVANDYENSSPEHIHQLQETMKTVYSPELLDKFLKDYANKMHAYETTSPEPVLEAFDDEVRDKYESIETDGGEDDGNRRVSITSSEDQETSSPNDVQERKRYRPGNNHDQHPYNKNNGWVSLEAVPWSKSKVSKWQSAVKPYQSQNNYNGGFNRPTRPPYSYEDYGNNNDNDDYYNQKPTRPTFQNNQFYGSVSSYNRPIESHHSQSSHQSSSFNNNYDNDRPNRPYQPEIITDNRPSNFPSHHEQSHNNEYSYNRPNSYENQRPSYENQRPSYENQKPSYENQKPSYENNRPNRPYEYQYSGGQNVNHYSNKDGQHPMSYPSGGGDGEWVLVSTTKGYQFPKRNGQRAMLFNAQNGVGGSDTRKNDNRGIITAASQQYENVVSIRPPFQSGPTKMTQQQVKLTVLPLLTKNENRPHQSHNQQHYPNNNHETSVYRPASYNGIIETEPSTQTVEESVAAAATANEVNSIAASAQKLPKKKRKHTKKNYAVMRKNPGSDSTAVLAAVGAGLLPASLGLFAPMVLG